MGHRTELFEALFAGLFDDAAMFPPADTKLPTAIRGYARHRLAWYSGTVGPFVCNSRRLPELGAEAARLHLDGVDVAAVVPEGLDRAATLAESATGLARLAVRAVEVPLRSAGVADARRILDPLIADGALGYVEVPATELTERQVHELGDAGLRLKLRTGGTNIDAFQTEHELAAALVMCAAERLPFKCTAGLHNAVRHRDPATTFEHHGFLNVALATRVAATTGSVAATAATLADRDPSEVAAQVRELAERDIAAVRAMFCSFGTCSVAEPITDLVAMGLVVAR